MKKLLFLPFLLIYGLAFAAPDSTMSISPSASDGTVITASDENTRNNSISTTYNAHSHTDISQVGNTLNVGDAAVGNKTITAYNADASKPFLRYDDTQNHWIFSTDGTTDDTELSGGIVKFEGVTADAFETTIDIEEPTVDRKVRVPNADSVTLPSGAVFFMITGSCPTGTTDVSATYSNKFIKINATAGTSAGTVLTGTSDSTTLSAAQSGLPAHTHTYDSMSGGSGTGNGGNSNMLANGSTTGSTGGTAASSGHTHTFSAATTLEPSSITMKLCSVN